MNNKEEKENQEKTPGTSINDQPSRSGLVRNRITFGFGTLLALVVIIWPIANWYNGLDNRFDKMDQKYTKLKMNHNILLHDVEIQKLRKKIEDNSKILKDMKEKMHLTPLEETWKEDLEKKNKDFEDKIREKTKKKDGIETKLNAGLSPMNHPKKTDKSFKNYYAQLLFCILSKNTNKLR
jgi:hypothetical protein